MTFLHSERNIWVLYFLFLFIIGLATFSNLSSHLFHTHDESYLVDAEKAQDHFALIVSPSQIEPGRPTFQLYLWFAHKVWQKNPAGYHIALVVLHIFASCLVALTCWHLGAKRSVSFTTGLLFLLNVAHFKAVHWISCTGYPIALSLSLLTILCYHTYLKTTRLRWLLITIPISAAAVFAHASAAIVAPFLLIITWLKKPDHWRAYASTIPIWGTVGICGLLLISLYPNTPQNLAVVNPIESLEILQNFFWFLGRMITTAHWLPAQFDLSRRDTWEIGIGVLSSLGMLFLAQRDKNNLMLWVGWTSLALFPFINANWSHNISGPSRYLYLASAGFSFVIASLLCITGHHMAQWIPKQKKVAFLCLLGTLCISSVWSLKKSEVISLCHSGRTYISQGNSDLGVEQLNRAFLQAPEYMPAISYVHLSVNAFAQGIPLLEHLKKAETLYPENHDIKICLSIAQLAQHVPEKLKTTKAHLQVLIASANDETYTRQLIAKALHNLGSYQHEHHNLKEAIAIYTLAIQIWPNYPLAFFNLGNALYQSGDRDNAILILRQTIDLDPSFAQAKKHLESILQTQQTEKVAP